MTIVDVAQVLGDLKKWQEVAEENANLRSENAELRAALYDGYCCMIAIEKLATDTVQYMPGLPKVIESIRAILERTKK